jgi:O-acetyl-ADP-ribose deacetylase (regulator of RNase III)
MIETVTGDLIQARVDALVNPVNTVGVMGKGLALQFKRAFPANYVAYRAAAKRGDVRIGQMFVFELGGAELPRYILNFPTKRDFRKPSELEYIESGLRDLIGVIRARSVRSLAIPRLGAGLGGLDWAEVRPLIERAFTRLPDVRALLYEPDA